MKNILLSLLIGFPAAWFLAGLSHNAITGRNYLNTDTEGFAWFGGTWAVAAVLTWVIFWAVKRRRHELER